MISALTTEIGKSGIFLCHNIPFSQACFGKIPVQGKEVIKEYTFKVRNYEHSLNVFFSFYTRQSGKPGVRRDGYGG